jgi:mono/diheme cytochrome c family protein
MRFAWSLLLSSVLLSIPAAWAAGEALNTRGEYLYRITGCENCHTDRENKGKPLAGGRRLETPLGTFVSPNITPDLETGIGKWSEEDFIRALRHGVSPSGAHYYPAFPYTSYTLLTDEDLRALYAYLRAVPAVHRPNEAHELPWYLRRRALLIPWKWIYFRQGPYKPKAEKSDVWNRGAYLVRAAAHCSECHTPRDPLGGTALTRYLAGNKDGPDDSNVPNITPHKTAGIGRWSKGDVSQYLETGMTPEGDYAGKAMGEFIDNGLKYLTPADRVAIAEYLFSLPPNRYDPRGRETPKKTDDDF